MKIRVMGMESECFKFSEMVRKAVPNEYLRSISPFYKNPRGFSNEGRVYIDFRDFPEGSLVNGTDNIINPGRNVKAIDVKGGEKEG